MSDAAHSGHADFRDSGFARTAELDLEVWRHFAEMGGQDKNTMITTVSWLLTFAHR